MKILISYLLWILKCFLVIGQVGPKYVYDVVGNPYHDSTGRPTNGSTTGCHLHVTIKLDSNAVNPLDYIEV